MKKSPAGYKLIISNRARNVLKILPKRYQQTIILTLMEIQENPLIGKSLARERTGQFSYKVGTYRIIYRINKKDRVIQVLSAGHRSTVYQ